MANPLILDYKRQQLQRLPVPADASPMLAAPMPSPTPYLPAPAAPVVSQIDPAIQATRNRILGDQAEYQRKLDSGSGISQIKNPVLHGLAKAGEIGLSILAPGIAAATPGTENHHQFLLRQDQGRLGEDIGQEYSQAKTGQEQALTDYTLQRPAIARAGLEQKVQTSREKYTADLRKHGINVTGYDDETGLPTTQDDPDTMAYHQAAAENFIHTANAEKANILSGIAKNKYLPGTEEFNREMERIHQKDKQIAIAMGALGLRAQSVQLRRNDQNANFYGMGPDGNPLPNAPQFQDDAGNVTTGGLKGAKTAITQQGKVGQFKDLQGSVTHTQDALEALHRSGGALSDAQMVAAMSDPHSSIGKYVNGQLVRGNLNDQQIQALGALNQLREQIGILRSTTGGTAAEAQAQRMLETLPAPGDSPAIVRNKLHEINGVLSRLTPSVPTTAGGLSIGGRGGHGGQPGTVTMQAPDGTKMPVPADQVEHYKQKGAKVVQ